MDDLANPKVMAELADDVRRMEEPFVREAVTSFESLFRSEYRRLRAAAIEGGSDTATLNVKLECRFTPGSRSIDMTSSPVAVPFEPRRKAVAVAAGKSE